MSETKEYKTISEFGEGFARMAIEKAFDIKFTKESFWKRLWNKLKR